MAGVGVALPLWAGASQWQLRLSTSSIQFGNLPLAEACEQIAKLGFEAIDLWDKFTTGCTHLEEAEKLGGDGLKALLARHRLKLAAFTVYKTGYEQYAALLGATGGGLAVRGSLYAKFRPEELTSRMKKFFEQLKPQMELAEKFNSCLAIENHSGAMLNSPDSFKAFVDCNPAPSRVGIALAPFHLQRIGALVEEAIRTAGAQLRFFYAWQKVEGMKAEGIGQLPGHGTTDFKPWLDALAEIRYTGYVNPFMHGDLPTGEMAAALAKSRDYLRKLPT